MNNVNSTTASSAGRMVSAGDISLLVHDIGEGRPVVWLHGGGPGTTGMGAFGALLPAFYDYRNVVFDLPRFGRSDRPIIDGPLIPYATDRVKTALAELGIERAHVVGMAVGAAVGVELAAEHPSLVERLVVATVPVTPAGFTPPDAVKTAVAYMSAPKPSRELIANVLETAVYDTSLITDEILDERLAVAARSHPEIAPPTTLGDVVPSLGRVRSRTLVLWGRDDAFLPVDPLGRFVAAEIPNAELNVIPRCGHQPHLEHPELFIKTIRNFLEED